MEDAIRSLPAQLTKGIQLGKAARLARAYRTIVSCGMGGSSIAGEILSMIQDNVIVHWDYDLPDGVSPEDLVICTSWSGDTEETISSYEKARELGLETLVITHGGRLEQLAKKNKSPLVVLPSDAIAPRTAEGYMVGALFAALGLDDRLPATLDADGMESKGRALATVLGATTPVLYSSYPWRKVTGFWKMAYSETAKRHVFTNWFPSGAHNEVVGWEGPYQKQMTPVIIRDPSEAARYSKNFDALLAVLSEKGYTVHTVELSGDTVVEKVLNSYILALWTGFHVASDLGIDPQATKLLDEFKRLKAHN